MAETQLESFTCKPRSKWISSTHPMYLIRSLFRAHEIHSFSLVSLTQVQKYRPLPKPQLPQVLHQSLVCP